MKIKGIVFDLDGVITDTAEFHYQAWKIMAEKEGFRFDRKLNEQLRGVSRSDSIEIIFRHNNTSATPKVKQKLMEQKNTVYIKLLDHITEKDYLPGIKDFLKILQQNGIKMGLGSASKNAGKVLKNLNATHFFDIIGDGNSVKKSKPAPDLFLFVAQKLGLQPRECIVIEDAESGIEAAHRAGMQAIGIGPEERIGKAELVLTNTLLLSIERLKKLENITHK